MRRAFVLVLIALLTTVVSVAQEDPALTVRAIWTPETLVLINTSAEGVDVSELALESANGEVTPENWVVATDDSGISYSLTDVRPGSCLVAFLAGTSGQIPESVDCTRVIAETTLENPNDVVWSVSNGSFTPVLAGESGEACDTLNRSSCDIVVNPANTNTMETDTLPETVDVRAIWTLDIFVLINTSEYGADWSELSFENESGAILPSNWVVETDDEGVSYDLSDVRPGSCAIAYLSTDGAETEIPELPEDVDCTRIIASFPAENLEDVVWSLDGEGFTPVVAGEAGEDCAVVGTTTCDITVPNADAMDDDTDDTDATTDTGADAPLRAIWNPDVFVLINISDDGVDLSSLSFQSADGEILASNWILETDDMSVAYTLEDVRPGSCLVAYLSEDVAETEIPELPEGVDCTRIIAYFPVANINDIVWSIDAGGFTPVVDGVAGQTCEITGTTTCDISLP